MSRIPPIDRSAFEPSLQTATDHLPDDALGSVRVYAHAPELAVAWLRFIEAIHASGSLPSRTVELVRLRIASHNQCPRCMSMRLDPEEIDETTVCELDRTPVEDLTGLSQAEQAAVRFGELMATDHSMIDDALFDVLAAHYTNEQMVELALKAASFVGFGRLGAVIRLVDDLPAKYARTGRLRYSQEL